MVFVMILIRINSKGTGAAGAAGVKCLLFFAVYKIYKKNYSFSTVYSGVKFLFFYLTKTANSIYSKIHDSSMVRTTAFSSSRFGVRVSVVPNVFTIYP